MYLFTLLVWAIFGLVFWPPLLSRAIVIFTSLILYATLIRQDARFLGDLMDFATRFYADGFRKIHAAIYDESRS